MKIRHQLILLMGLPFGSLVLTIALLMYSFGRVEELASRELRAKRAISLGLQLRSTLEQSVLMMTTQSIIGGGLSKTDSQRKKIESEFANLRLIAASEPEAVKLLEKTHKDVLQFLDLWEELACAYHPGQGDQLFFSQFLGKNEFRESMQVSFERVKEDTEKLVAIYTPIAQEFHPQALRARANLRVTIVGAVIFNLILVVAFAVVLNRNTLLRLAVLSENMKAFSKGKSPTTRLKGNDELSELDNAFSEMARELAKLEELKQSMRAMVNHDLRSPLTSMSLRLELMLDESLGYDRQKINKDIKILKSEIDRLGRLANTLLDIEKMEDGSISVQIADIPVRAIVDVSLDAISTQAKRKDIDISCVIPEPCMLKSDKDRTIQVLINFLSNAVKFAPKKSRIEIHAIETPDSWRLEVLDEGPGVTEEKQHKLFGKFSQLDQPEDVRKQGSGLGLYICKMLIEAQAGQVGYVRRESGGSCFWLTLPKAEPPCQN